MKTMLYNSIEMPWCLTFRWTHCSKGKHSTFSIVKEKFATAIPHTFLLTFQELLSK